MADQQPVDPAPAAGAPDPTRAEDPAEPATRDLPSRWSGAAAVPEPSPRRSMWDRLRDRVTGPRQDRAEDHWATMPAVDPWADQDTPLWPEGYATDTLHQSPSPDTGMPPTRLDAAPPPTRLDASASAYPNAASPAAAKAADVAEKAVADAIAAGAKLVGAAKSAAAVAAAKAAEQAAKAGHVAKEIREGFGPDPEKNPHPAKTSDAGRTPDTGRTPDAAKAGQAAAATPSARPTLPPPGTYPPPAAGTGLPPQRPAPPAGATGLSPQRPARFRPWRRAPKAKTAAPARIPVQPRPVQPRPPQPRPMPSRPAPPPWAAPPKKRGRLRRWMRRMTLLTIVGLVLCCGGPLAYWQFPAARQYPVSAVLPSTFDDLDLRDTDAGRRAAERLAAQLQDAGSSGEAFAGIYTDRRGKRVTLFGVTGWRTTPASDVDAQLERLADELKIKSIETYDVGEFGVHERCGVGRLDGASVVACAWADHGSLATVLLTRRSLSESAELVAELRSQVLTPKYWG
ncbi:hypothetical protein AB0M02_45565 [Actinoplanes sp. NPDC051861]|uniref:hypothetical protein n=1 Tax=Actinoplanes sp. NPDC051861 TaxID=3155170 RepID=UPI0034211046